MRRALSVNLLIAVLILQAFPALAESYKLETIPTSPEGVSESLKGMLQAQGIRVLSEQGTVWSEIWLRKEIANLNKPASPDAKYQSLHLGSLLGVMRFPGAGSDYRGQTIQPGTFTLRYCLILQDGNHMGAAPILDFVLLIPAAEDTRDPDAILTLEEMVNLSRKASGTNHPAVINMAPPASSATEPLLEKDDLDHWVLRTKTQTKSGGELPIGIVVVGRAEA